MTRRGEEEEEDFELEGKTTLKCSLCLGPMVNSTATGCGHVFCWKCIADWCNTKVEGDQLKMPSGLTPLEAECPLCRQPTSPSELIVLYNI